jgi:hypothetical protein
LEFYADVNAPHRSMAGFTPRLKTASVFKYVYHRGIARMGLDFDRLARGGDSSVAFSISICALVLSKAGRAGGFAAKLQVGETDTALQARATARHDPKRAL